MPTELTPARRDALIRWLRSELRGEVRFDRTSRLLYATDASIYQIEPLGVVLPRDRDDVEKLVRIAADQDLPLLPRGAGTSLSGQAIGRAIVVDFSKYMNRILSYDPARQTVRVQPGVVLDQLNRFLANYGVEFGPDVATSSRATLGGMIGNNSAGARSVVYGKTIDHVVELSVLFSDGSAATLAPLSAQEWQQLHQAPGREGEVCRAVERILRDCRDEIRRRFPRVLRRVSGYNLDEMLRAQQIADGVPPQQTYPFSLPPRMPLPDPHQPWNLARLVVGSEGTLAIVTDALLRVHRRPALRVLLLLAFEELIAALDAVGPLLETGPSAIECLDRLLLQLAEQNTDAARYRALIPGEPDAVLVVEYSGESEAELLARCQDALRRAAEGRWSAHRLVTQPGEVDAVWALRKKGVALLYSMPGGRKPIGFVEDTAVEPARLGEFVRRFRSILRRHGVEGSFYGHASVGCLHIRPLLDLRQPKHVEIMRQIAREVVELVLEFEGALSGEHGDGLARSEFNRVVFGDRLYEAFRTIKRAFDPASLLNPGKIVDAPAMTEHLRPFASGPNTAAAGGTLVEPTFRHRTHDGFAETIDSCMGAAVCRKLTGTMCPSYMVTLEEMHSTRGRANLLRAALAGLDVDEEALLEALDLCLMCKGCKAECPANVDMALLKTEYLHDYYRRHRRPILDYAVAYAGRLNRLAALAPRLVNFLTGRDWFRGLLEWAVGIDRRRPLPRLARHSFRNWYAANRRRLQMPPGSSDNRPIYLLADCFSTYYEPHVLGMLARLLHTVGYPVHLAPLRCCGRTFLSKGMLDEFRSLARTNVQGLSQIRRQGGVVVGVEPSCVLTFRDEYTELPIAEGREQLLRETVLLAEEFLLSVLDRMRLKLAPSNHEVLIHGHCHQKAAGLADLAQRLLQQVPGLVVELLDTGCCGMAGFFGYERRHYEISVAIARRDLLKKLTRRPGAILAAGGFSCRSQVRDLTDRTVLHPVELFCLAAGIGHSDTL